MKWIIRLWAWAFGSRHRVLRVHDRTFTEHNRDEWRAVERQIISGRYDAVEIIGCVLFAPDDNQLFAVVPSSTALTVIGCMVFTADSPRAVPAADAEFCISAAAEYLGCRPKFAGVTVVPDEANAMSV